nr:uncharacterized protein LOC131107998 isoform X2 [Doryrhamphus excisus]
MDSIDAANDQMTEEGLQHLKPRSCAEFLGQSRCAGCYNQHKHSMPRQNSSSSTDDSDSNSDSDSDSESGSDGESSSSSDGGLSQEEAEPAHEADGRRGDEQSQAGDTRTSLEGQTMKPAPVEGAGDKETQSKHCSDGKQNITMATACPTPSSSVIGPTQ